MNHFEPKNLLIVRTDRIGDVVLSLPLARIVKKYYSECKVTFLVRSYTREIVENHPFIDNVLTLIEEKGKVNLKKNIRLLRDYNFDSSIIVYPTFSVSLIIFLARIKNRIGTGYRWYSFLFNWKVHEHRKYAEKHELEFNVNLLKKFNINEEISPANVKFDLHTKPDTDELVERKLQERGISLSKPIIIFHPGSLGSSVDLPVEKFEELINLVNKKNIFQIILTGSSNERDLCERLVLNEKVKNFAGEFDLSELISIINMSEIFVSNSTGPIHIAAALNKYTIGFYPKILACSAKRWGPYTKNAVVFNPETDCKNCSMEQCSSLDCMNSIDISEVFAEIEKIYKLVYQ